MGYDSPMIVRLLIALIVVVILMGCNSRQPAIAIAPPDVTTEAMDVEKPGTAAEQDVIAKKEAAAKARASGDVLVTLNAERNLASSRARLAKEQVKQWEQAAKDKDNEIREERDRRRQEFLYWFSGICGFLAIIATAGAFVWPTTRIVTRPIAVILGALVPLSLFAAWLVPYLPFVTAGVGVMLLGGGAWYLSRNENAHKLKDKAALQVAAAVEESKDTIPEFAAGYKPIFRGHIDHDADQLMTAKRQQLADMEADEAARVARVIAA